MGKFSKAKGQRVLKVGKFKPQEVDEETEILQLQQRVGAETPESGSQLSSNGELRFDAMPISSRTLEGLSAADLTVATEIQAAAIPHALAGRDILGAAKTGSGKTLAFVVPLIEKLYVERWSPGDGLAGVIITPTRELAMQIFEVLRLVGRKHSFSAGLVTGGRKDFEGEQERISTMNILVATPGRFLQHLEQTPGFDASQVLMLILDEADRILDMGFKAQLDSIVGYLPRSRQTMLFSATQTKSVKDLARLSLKRPEYLAVHAASDEATPTKLVQNYICCALPEKLDILFSFLKTHLKSKMIVFFSTCSQVRFVHECFCAMQPGVPVSALHGKIKQDKRTQIYVDFTRKKFAVLLCTDIAARGLDFPNVDWVVQVDAPEDAAMYVHRVGRTARNDAAGRALLMLLPTEERGVVEMLGSAVPLKKLTVNPTKRFTVATKAAALLAAQPELKALAKKAFTGYLRSLQLLPGGRALADPSSTLPVAEFASALGLAFAPPLPAITSKPSAPAPSEGAGAGGGEIDAARSENREKKNVNRALDKLKKQIKEAKEAKKAAKLLAQGGAPVDVKAKEEGEEEEELFTVKQTHNFGDMTLPQLTPEQAYAQLSIKQKKKLDTLKLTRDGTLKVALTAGAKKTTFDDEGNAIDRTIRLRNSEKEGEGEGVGALGTDRDQRMAEHALRVKERVDQGREEDNLRERQRLKEKRMKLKVAVGNNRQGGEDEEEGGGYAVLGGGGDSGSGGSGDDGSGSGDDGNSDNGGDRVDKASDSDSDGGGSDESSVGFKSSKRKSSAAPAAAKKQRTNNSKANDSKANNSDDSDDSDSDEDSDEEGGMDEEEVKKNEALVMAMLKKR
ncbi:P-loop containing nucleoside triphosphate hydrolase protein [Ochromonadaceae sp. CCMP2298]|nr:P-loop containing nucleoside triphosphate hydrolase protein [Ochromonadaceae sp. CCMP2298]